MKFSKSFAAMFAAATILFSGTAFACNKGQCPHAGAHAQGHHGQGQKMCNHAGKGGHQQGHMCNHAGKDGTCPHNQSQSQSGAQSQGHAHGHDYAHGHGHGKTQEQVLDTPLTVEDVTNMMGRKLEWRGNPRLKVGAVTQTDDATIIAEVVTLDGSLVEKYAIATATGQWTTVND